MASIENQSYGLNSYPGSNESFPIMYHTPEQFDSYETLTSDINSNSNETIFQRQYEEHQPDPSYFNQNQNVNNNQQSQLLNPPLYISNNNINNNNYPIQDSYNNNSYIFQDKPNFVPMNEPNPGVQYATNINNSYPGQPDLTGYATYQFPKSAEKFINDSSNFANGLASTPIQINQPGFINYSANFASTPAQQPAVAQIKAGIPFIAQETCFKNKFFSKLGPIAYASIPQANLNNNFSFNGFGLNMGGLNNFSNLFNKLAMNHHHLNKNCHHHHHHFHPNLAFNNGFNAFASLKTRLGNCQMMNSNFNAFGNFALARNGFGFNAGFNKLLNPSLNKFGARLIY